MSHGDFSPICPVISSTEATALSAVFVNVSLVLYLTSTSRWFYLTLCTQRILFSLTQWSSHIAIKLLTQGTKCICAYQAQKFKPRA